MLTCPLLHFFALSHKKWCQSNTGHNLSQNFLSEKRRPGEETRRVLPSLYNVMSNESKRKCVFFSSRKLEKSIRKSWCREKLNYERWSEERVADCWIEVEKLEDSEPLYNCVSQSASNDTQPRRKCRLWTFLWFRVHLCNTQPRGQSTLCTSMWYTLIHSTAVWCKVILNSATDRASSSAFCRLQFRLWYTAGLQLSDTQTNNYALCSTVTDTQSHALQSANCVV